MLLTAAALNSMNERHFSSWTTRVAREEEEDSLKTLLRFDLKTSCIYSSIYSFVVLSAALFTADTMKFLSSKNEARERQGLTPAESFFDTLSVEAVMKGIVARLKGCANRICFMHKSLYDRRTKQTSNGISC